MTTSMSLLGAVDLAGPPNLHIGRGIVIGRGVVNAVGGKRTIETLIGADNRGFDDALKDTSPSELLPIGVKQALILGGSDPIVPAEQGQLYQAAAARKGEAVEVIVIPTAAHNDFILTQTEAWRKSLSVISEISIR